MNEIIVDNFAGGGGASVALPPPKLKFPPMMTLQAAARIAGQHGLDLIVEWDGKQAQVTTRPKHESEHVPAFLRRQCDPSGEIR